MKSTSIPFNTKITIYVKSNASLAPESFCWMLSLLLPTIMTTISVLRLQVWRDPVSHSSVSVEQKSDAPLPVHSSSSSQPRHTLSLSHSFSLYSNTQNTTNIYSQSHTQVQDKQNQHLYAETTKTEGKQKLKIVIDTWQLVETKENVNVKVLF